MILNSIHEISIKLKNREISVKNLIDDLINDVAARDSNLGAFVSFDPELLLQDAKQADDQIALSKFLGTLHGIPIGIKDIIDVAGYPTRCGSEIYSGEHKKTNATVVDDLRTSGAIIAGKTTSHELACGVTSPPASNPWNINYIPGGSSGGSGVAVACGYLRAALGSDTGGSIRIPASLCGIVGLKPTYGLITTTGIEPLSTSLDHVGPLTASVEDCALVMNSLVNSRRVDYDSELDNGINGMRIGVLAGKPFSPMHSAVQQAFENAIIRIQELGARCVNIEIPELEHTLAVEFGIIPREAAEHHIGSLRKSPELISEPIRTLLVAGRIMPKTSYLRACQGRKIISRAIRCAFEENYLDAVITPSLPATAAKKGQKKFSFGDMTEDISVSYVRTTAPFNISGQPAISIPCGRDSTGLPIGLQIATRPYQESRALRIAHTFANGIGWSLLPPKSF